MKKRLLPKFTLSNIAKGYKSGIKETTTRDFNYSGEKRCIVPGCGRHIRTGWKYCFEHRNTQQFREKKRGGDQIVGLGMILMLVGMVIIIAGSWIFGLIVIVTGVLCIISQPKINNRNKK